MDIQRFTEIMDQAAVEQNARLNRFTTDVQDFRFGIRNIYIAASFEKNGISTVMEFRVGDVKLLIDKFNTLPGVSARQHASNRNMLEVRINNGNFTNDVIAQVNKCAARAVRQYKERH